MPPFEFISLKSKLHDYLQQKALSCPYTPKKNTRKKLAEIRSENRYH